MFGNSEGKQQVASDLLNNVARKGDSSAHISLTSHVGAGSSWHVLHSADPISLLTSSVVTARHPSNVESTLSSAKEASEFCSWQATRFLGVGVT